MTVAVFADSGVNPAKGTQGGLPGRAHYIALKDLNTGVEAVTPSFGQFEMQPHQRLVGIDAGGGGYGSPLEREVQSVRLDVLEGYVSLQSAKDVYGVVFSGQVGDESLAVDAAQTHAQRAAIYARSATH
jgi:N-methylhydantoinase B